MGAICGANCSECSLYLKECKGCQESNGCPFGKKCWIAKYIESGGEENFDNFKKQIMEEFNDLRVEGMPKITELYPLHGAFVNMAYPLPSGKDVSFIKDEEAYLGTQVECLFNDGDIKRCFGLLANTTFLLVAEYGENGSNPELVIYKRR